MEPVGGADDDAVAGEGRGLHAVALHRELNHPGNGALGDGGVVERQLVKEHLSLAAHRGAEHHALFHPVVVGREPGEELQLPGLQLCHKAHGADVDAENGHMVTGGNLGGVENGAVAAKADEQIRILNFPVNVEKPHRFGQFKILVHVEGQADLGLGACLLEDFHRLLHVLEISIPVGIGGHYNFHGSPLQCFMRLIDIRIEGRNVVDPGSQAQVTQKLDVPLGSLDRREGEISKW